ncbi:MAG: hypothetical protein ACYS22_15585, partial [Planctomycetota bacterium]
IDGQALETIPDLIKVLKTRSEGDAIELTVMRGIKTLTLTGVFVPRPKAMGEVGGPAAPWAPTRWAQLPEDGEPSPTNLRGKAYVIFLLQADCPGTAGWGLVNHSALELRYPDRDRVRFIYLQTAFQDPEANTFEAGLEQLRARELEGAYGFDPRGPDGELPSAMRGYRAKGTPWSVVVDTKGIVRYSDVTPRDVNHLAFTLNEALGIESDFIPEPREVEIPLPRRGAKAKDANSTDANSTDANSTGANSKGANSTDAKSTEEAASETSADDTKEPGAPSKPLSKGDWSAHPLDPTPTEPSPDPGSEPAPKTP